jgi:Uri superfamily endonuclease
LPDPGKRSKEQGTYVLFVSLDRDRKILIGKLGQIKFRSGTYAYCGSAMAGYRTRVGRHFSQDKKLHWHIDYLLQEAEPICAFLIPGGKDMECLLARLLSSQEGSEPVPRFGSSDCKCPSHLYHIEELSIRSLTDSLERLRIRTKPQLEND